MPRKKREGRFWGEAGAVYLSSKCSEVKRLEQSSRFLLVDCCNWMVIVGSACVDICWKWEHWERESGVWVAMAENWRSRSPHERRIGYLLWLMSCWLSQLNPGVRGEHLTSQFSWVATWLLVTRVWPVYLVEKVVLVFYAALWLDWCIIVVLLAFLAWWFCGKLLLF